MFNSLLNNVVLIRKNKPSWQSGKLNGVGGHIEEKETPEMAMGREFLEEVDYPYTVGWSGFATLKGEDFEVYIFNDADNGS